MQYAIIFSLLGLGLIGMKPLSAAGQKTAAPASRNSELSTAAWNGNLEAVNSLLAAGTNPNATDEKGVTPLMATASWEVYDAIEGGKEERHAKIAGLLLSKGAKIDAQDKTGMTALIRASAFYHPGIALTLLNNGADVNKADKQGRTALTWAARLGAKDTSLVQPLLQKGARIRLMEALLFGDMPKARVLVATANLEMRGLSNETPLMLAARAGDMPLVQMLLSRSVQVNAADDEGLTALESVHNP